MPYDDNLDNSAKIMVDTIVNYDIVAEKCAARLRRYDQALIGRLWKEQEMIFMGDPVKYPSVMVAPHDTEGRNQFWAKCQALCFPPESQRPPRPQECVPCPLNSSLFYNLVS